MCTIDSTDCDVFCSAGPCAICGKPLVRVEDPGFPAYATYPPCNLKYLG